MGSPPFGILEQERFDDCGPVLIFAGRAVSAGKPGVQICSLFPDLSGIMIGRGLLARPTLAREWRDGRPLDNTERLAASLEMHRRLYDTALQTLQGDQQILARMQAFWEYQKPLIDKKVYKRLMKTTSLRNYEEAVRSLA